ncbi:MAG TPA: hypothetical protein VN581_09580 [Patescibacteria group bacterium]|nr:hypothetical protein [Patescibacteria group bacterium]
MLKKLALGLGMLVLAQWASAEPIRFEFEYAQPGGPATASGYIVLESTQIANPGRNDINLPSPAVLDLSITIVGAESGNGTFTTSDFGSIVFDTNGGTLDFSRSLMGQPTDGLPWGTPPEGEAATQGEPGESGDFNLFLEGMSSRSEGYAAQTPPTSATAGELPPNGIWWYTLGADGGGANTLVLTAFGPAATRHAVPSTGLWALIVLGVLLASVAWFHHRR